MRYASGLLLLATLLATSVTTLAQDPDVSGLSNLDDVLREESLNEQAGGTESLLLDNTRSKIGRDFYDAFYRFYQDMAPAGGSVVGQLAPNATPANPSDTARVTVQKPLEFELNLFLVSVDELPANSGIGSIMSVSINDELIFQQFLQNRGDTIEEYAGYVAQLVRDYVDNYAQTQRDLENEDLRGSGVY